MTLGAEVVCEFTDFFPRLWTMVTSYVEKSFIWEKNYVVCVASL